MTARAAVAVRHDHTDIHGPLVQSSTSCKSVIKKDYSSFQGVVMTLRQSGSAQTQHKTVLQGRRNRVYHSILINSIPCRRRSLPRCKAVFSRRLAVDLLRIVKVSPWLQTVPALQWVLLLIWDLPT